MSEIQEMTIEDVINTTKKNNRKSDSKLIRKVYNYAWMPKPLVPLCYMM